MQVARKINGITIRFFLLNSKFKLNMPSKNIASVTIGTINFAPGYVQRLILAQRIPTIIQIRFGLLSK